MKGNDRKDGVCKLTGAPGKFVDAHLLPRALTTAGGLGMPLTEAGRGTRPITRHSSWYDNRLVTAEGEAILAALDSWAIKVLRETKLVWSGWGPMHTLSDVRQIVDSDWGVRTLSGRDWKRLRLFMLSLLWRAGASERQEFDEIALPPDHLETLRQMIVNGDAEPIDFYPVHLVQLTTLGMPHNHTPISSDKVIPALEDGTPDKAVSIFRFYIDGLIVHFDRISIEESRKREYGDIVLGNSDRLIVSGVRFEGSAQREYIEQIIHEAESFRR